VVLEWNLDAGLGRASALGMVWEKVVVLVLE